jgi:hypothetical protein
MNDQLRIILETYDATNSLHFLCIPPFHISHLGFVWDPIRLLNSYCFYRPDVGYVQGMSYLAGHLLLYMEPYAAFVCFANLLNSNYFLTFLKMNRDAMQDRYDIFSTLFKESIPSLYRFVFSSFLFSIGPREINFIASPHRPLVHLLPRRTFEAENIMPEMYLLEWCLTLFSKRLSLDVVSRIWDCYLLFGESVVYRIAVVRPLISANMS